ncbi:MAG: chromosomal replication initiator protein DnaA [Lentisphaerae bacterium]|nr:chromosomal replication initiator protein DnaA [Lentisphaerota bacterium]
MMSSVVELWQAARVRLREILNEDTFTRWIAGIVPVRREESKVVLGVSCGMFSDWLTLNYLELIERTLREVSGEAGLSVAFESGHEAPAAAEPAEAVAGTPEGSAPPAPDEAPARPRRSRKHTSPVAAPETPVETLTFNRRFSFNTFVVGENNRFAHAACVATAAAPGAAYNPLFIHSPTGLGKTHLLQATAQELLRTRPRARIAYRSSEEFSNEFIEAIRSGTMSAFRARYRSVDLLLIDDVHFFAAKERLQEEFFHTFNALYHGHKQIVLTSDRPPHEIGGVEKRLVSRFEWGLTTDIAPPDLETRVAILRRKQDDHAIKLGDDILFLIAGRIRSNIRRLEGALISLVSYASVTGTTLDVAKAEEHLGPLLDEEPASLVTVEHIQRTVAEFYDIRVSDMLGNRRPQNIAMPRQVAMFLCRELTSYSSPAIGEHFHRNHATVLHAQQVIKDRLAGDPEFQREISVLRRKIRA